MGTELDMKPVTTLHDKHEAAALYLSIQFPVMHVK
jgi:hypothetical protein